MPRAPPNILPYAFIAMGHSGTTWLMSVLNRHPCVHCAGEDSCNAMKRSTNLIGDGPKASFGRWDDLLPSNAYFDLNTPILPCEQFDGRWNGYHACPPQGGKIRHPASVRESAAMFKNAAFSSCENFAIGGNCKCHWQPDRDMNVTNTTALSTFGMPGNLAALDERNQFGDHATRPSLLSRRLVSVLAICPTLASFLRGASSSMLHGHVAARCSLPYSKGAP